MKTKIAALLLTLIFGAVSVNAQEKSKKAQPKAGTSTEKTMGSACGGCQEMKAASCCSQAENKSGTKQAKNESSSTQASAFTCPMHPEVKSEKAGKCPKCGMDLTVKK